MLRVGTLVTVADGGAKPIEEIQVGDLVMTHLGRMRPVEKIHTRHHVGEVFEIRVSGLPTPLVVTGEHPVYAKVRRGPQQNVENRPEHGPSFVPASDLVPGDSVHTPTPIFGVPGVDFSEEVAFILGIYAAEGSLSRLEEPQEDWEIKPGVRMKRKNVGDRGGKVEFSLNPTKDIALKAAIVSYARNLPGTSVFVYPHAQTPHCEKVILSNRTFARFCAEHVGIGSATKRLSASLMAASPAVIRKFLAGYFAGDGSVSGRADGSREPRLTCCTASKQMAQQIFWMLDRIGVVGNMTTGMNSGGPSNRETGNPKWVLNVGPRECAKMSDVLGRTFIPRDNRKGFRVASAACTYGRIRSVARLPYAGTVYNLHVAEDESYVANLHTVHNCFHLKTQGKSRGYIETVPVLVEGVNGAGSGLRELLTDLRADRRNAAGASGAVPPSDAAGVPVCTEPRPADQSGSQPSG